MKMNSYRNQETPFPLQMKLHEPGNSFPMKMNNFPTGTKKLLSHAADEEQLQEPGNSFPMKMNNYRNQETVVLIKPFPIADEQLQEPGETPFPLQMNSYRNQKLLSHEDEQLQEPRNPFSTADEVTGTRKLLSHEDEQLQEPVI